MLLHRSHQSSILQCLHRVAEEYVVGASTTVTKTIKFYQHGNEIIEVSTIMAKLSSTFSKGRYKISRASTIIEKTIKYF